MRTSLLNREDPELGRVRLCRKCSEEWPLDTEFWYFDRRGYVMGYCRACWADRARTYRPRLKVAS